MKMNKKVFYSATVAWLPFAATIIIFSGLVYAAVQQNYRMNANDPQVQIAEDLVTAIGQGQPANQIVPAKGTTELANTLSPFVVIYDDSNKLIGSSAILDGKDLQVPSSVLDYAKAHGEYRVTWQPRAGIREALVIAHFGGAQPGFVVAGRSLREIEIREAQTLLLSELAGLAALVLSFIIILLTVHKSSKVTEIEKITEVEMVS